LSGELTIAIRNGLKRSAIKLLGKEEDFVKLEKQSDEVLIEENGVQRKLTQDEKDEVLDEVEEAAKLTEDVGGTRGIRQKRNTTKRVG